MCILCTSLCYVALASVWFSVVTLCCIYKSVLSCVQCALLLTLYVKPLLAAACMKLSSNGCNEMCFAVSRLAIDCTDVAILLSV